MRTIYQIDKQGIATGASREIGLKEGRPRDWVQSDVAPPDGIAQWRSDRWVSLSEYPAPPPTYATATEAKAAMVKWIDQLTAQVMDQYPRAVQARWGTEEAAARAVKAGTATSDQLALVTDEGAAKGRTTEEHADRIIFNAERFRAIADEINKLFLATDAALEAATDPAQYETILDAAKEQAAPIAQAYGLTT